MSRMSWRGTSSRTKARTSSRKLLRTSVSKASCMITLLELERTSPGPGGLPPHRCPAQECHVMFRCLHHQITPPSPFLPPSHIEQPDGVVEAAQRQLAPVPEQEALALRQIPHDVRHQYLASLGDSGDTGGPDNGRAEQVCLLRDRLAHVQAYAHADAFGTSFRRRTDLPARSW